VRRLRSNDSRATVQRQQRQRLTGGPVRTFGPVAIIHLSKTAGKHITSFAATGCRCREPPQKTAGA